MIGFIIGGVFLLSAALLPDALNPEVFILGAVIGFAPIFVMYVPRLCAAGALDVHHLVERLGGLVLIMLGETFLEMAVLFTKGAEPRAFGVVLVLILLTLVWWQYFTYTSAQPRRDSAATVIAYLAGHAMLVIGLGSAALSLTEVGLALKEQLPLPVLAGMLGGSMALIYAGLAVIVATTSAPALRTVILVLATAAFTVLGVLFWSAWEVDEQFLSVLMVIVSLAAVLLTAATTGKANKADISYSVPS